MDKVDDLIDFDRDRNSALERSTDDDVIELAERILMETDRPLIHTPDSRKTILLGEEGPLHF